MSDPKKGADLFDMAKDGTSSTIFFSSRLPVFHTNRFIVPGDAGKMNTIKSVPNPHQRDGEAAGGLGSTSLANAADNALNENEGREPGIGEVISATGHDVPNSVIGKPGGRGGTQGKEDIRADTGGFTKDRSADKS